MSSWQTVVGNATDKLDDAALVYSYGTVIQKTAGYILMGLLLILVIVVVFGYGLLLLVGSVTQHFENPQLWVPDRISYVQSGAPISTGSLEMVTRGTTYGA